MEHKIKLREEFADAVLSGEKSFEIRNNDRGYQKGDTIKFKTVDNVCLHIPHSVEDETFEITYVLSGWGLNPGYVALAIRRLNDVE